MASDVADEADVHCWQNLLDNGNLPLHILNMIMEQLALEKWVVPSLVLKETMTRKTKELGFLHALNPSYFAGVGMHANATPTDFHLDRMSAYEGVDAIMPFGNFRGCRLLFEHLKVAVDVEPGDIVLIRGAALSHMAGPWQGTGRFVFALFTDRRLSPYHRVKSSVWTNRLFGPHWKNFRHYYPAKPL